MGLPDSADKNADEEPVQDGGAEREEFLPFDEVVRQLIDLGVVVTHRGRWVDFFRLGKRGPVNPLYYECFTTMSTGKMNALRKALGNGTTSQIQFFTALTTGIPPPDVFFPVE